MAKICTKHDVSYDGEQCWCCEETELNKDPKKREAAYRNPEFLKKRGGLDAGAAAHAAVLGKLATLSPEQIDKLLALAGGDAPPPPAASSSSGGRRVVVAA